MPVVKTVVSIGILAILCAAVGQSQEQKSVELIPVSYDGLKREVLKHRGKVLLVDFWASYCIPCRKAFPRFIEMQKTYADKGFVVITVSMDAPENKAAVDAAATFLRQAKSPFPNLLLNEPAPKLDVKALPCYYLFDRQGKWARFGGRDDGDGVNYEELEKTVQQMLNEK